MLVLCDDCGKKISCHALIEMKTNVCNCGNLTFEKVQNVEENSNMSSVIDERMGNSFTAEGMEEVIELIIECVQPSSERRPVMSYVVMQLDKILEKEMSLTTVMGEATPTVILGSQLFRASK